MTGQQQADGVTGTSTGNRPWVTVQLSGQIGVAAGLAAGNVLQRLPDPLLKGRAANVQGQMGGSLSAQRNSGEGMTFSVVLPAKRLQT